jgi:hypothetical protein
MYRYVPLIQNSGDAKILTLLNSICIQLLLFVAFVPDVVTGADIFRNFYTWFYVQLRQLTTQ